jgi:hypothetical protein
MDRSGQGTEEGIMRSITWILTLGVLLTFGTVEAKPGFKSNFKFEEFESKTYKLFSRASEEISEEILARMEVMFKAYRAAYKHRKKLSETPILRIYANKQEFMQDGAPAGAGAYYNPSSKELVGYWNARNPEEFWNFFFHEGTHQFFDLAFPGFFESGDIPMWFSEGLADCFGCSRMDDDGRITINQLNTFLAKGRTRTVKQNLQAGRTLPFQKMLDLGQKQFMANASPNYAQAWSMCHFFWNFPEYEGDQGQYKFVIVKLVEAFKEGKKKDEAYEDAFTVRDNPLDMNKIEAEWKEWVKGLPTYR